MLCFSCILYQNTGSRQWTLYQLLFIRIYSVLFNSHLPPLRMRHQTVSSSSATVNELQAPWTVFQVGNIRYFYSVRFQERRFFCILNGLLIAIIPRLKSKEWTILISFKLSDYYLRRLKKNGYKYASLLFIGPLSSTLRNCNNRRHSPHIGIPSS